MVDALLYNMEKYKAAKSYERTDFEANVVTFYSYWWKWWHQCFLATDFGPMQVTVKTTEGMTWKDLLEYERKIEVTEKQIKDGYNRIKSKVKQLSWGYKNAVHSGSKSGSGRIIVEYFDILKEIWGKSLAVTVLSSAIASQEHCKTKKSQKVTVELEQRN